MSNTLLYKGYEGSIEYSREDDCLYGKVLGIDKRQLITYEGSSIDELKADFEAGIDDYLETCHQHGWKPAKPYSGTLSVRLTPALHAKAAQRSEELGISLNAFIKQTLQEAIQ
mgnify:CR=1 FL=1